MDHHGTALLSFTHVTVQLDTYQCDLDVQVLVLYHAAFILALPDRIVSIAICGSSTNIITGHSRLYVLAAFVYSTKIAIVVTTRNSTPF